MSRAGRKRKAGNRYANGQLRPPRQPSPLMIAASMPHRKDVRTVKDAVLDQRAESELGRMCLLGRIHDHQFTAGQRYATIVSAYRSTIKAPHGFETSTKGYSCRGDADCPDCECARRRARYDAAYCALVAAGHLPAIAVNRVAIQNQPCPYQWRKPLNLGLTALAAHLGLLTKGANGHIHGNVL